MEENAMIEQYKNGDEVFIYGNKRIFVGNDPNASHFGVVKDPNDFTFSTHLKDNMGPADTTIARWEEERRKKKEQEEIEENVRKYGRVPDPDFVTIPRSCFPYLLADQDQGSEYVPEDVFFYTRGEDCPGNKFISCSECGSGEVFVELGQFCNPLRSWCDHCEFLATKDVDPPEMLNEIHAYLEEQYPDWKFITNDSFSLTAVLGKHEIKVEVKGIRR